MPTWESGDHRLLQSLESALRHAGQRAGRWLLCRPGCAECCLGPFPITELDAWRLRRGLQRLMDEDPQRAVRILERARRVVEAMSGDFPGDRQTGLLWDEAPDQDGFFERHAAMPCPLLDPLSQLCELYAYRPISCRTFGLPVRIGEENLPPCRLCFQGAEARQIEACRVTVDPEGLEDALLREIGEGQTLIAWALLRVVGPAQPPWSSRSTSPACSGSPKPAEASDPQGSSGTDSPPAQSGLHAPHGEPPGS